MLSHEDNQRMCQVGKGTPMGEAVRRYWVPILSSYQLPNPDCDPVKVRIFGEDYVAFRNTEGKVGVLDEACRHRSASLALGRVENGGVRCLFHGWNFGVDGTVLETPSVADPNFKTRFKAQAYPVREAGGFIWAYFGPKELEPEFPHWRYFDVPEENRLTVTFVVNCNFIQLQEALLDSSHLTILHQDSFKRDSGGLDFVKAVSSVTQAADPKIEAEDTTFGFHYAAVRPFQGEDGTTKTMARVTSYVAPFHCVNANGDLIGLIVPIDDHRSVHHFVWWSDTKQMGRDPIKSTQLKYVGLDEETLHKFGLHYNTWHEPGLPSAVNNFRQDREAMRNGAWSGLPIFFPEDGAMLCSTGPIRDRSKEMLAPSDVAIGRLYRTLLNLPRQLAQGDAPTGVNIDARKVQGTYGFVPEGGKWQDLVPEHVVVNPKPSRG